MIAANKPESPDDDGSNQPNESAKSNPNAEPLPTTPQAEKQAKPTKAKKPSKPYIRKGGGPYNGGLPAKPFQPGNKLAHGNRQAKQFHEIRAALLAAVKPKDMAEIIAVLVRQAKGGDVASAKEVMDRILGKAIQPIFSETNVNVGGSIQIVYSDDWYGTIAANTAATNAAPAISVD
jgi:uncharacterized protein YbcI